MSISEMKITTDNLATDKSVSDFVRMRKCANHKVAGSRRV